MSLQETPGNSGDEPFLTERREETRRKDMKPFPRKKKISFLGNLRSLRNKKKTDCGDKRVKKHIFKLFT